jgi:hypothetical protein
VTNEKGLVVGSGLGHLAEALAYAGDERSLSDALTAIETATT